MANHASAARADRAQCCLALAQAERQRQATKPNPVVLCTFSLAGRRRPTVDARLPPRLGIKNTQMRTNFVLIDFENVQPSSLEALGLEHFKLLVFVGASQAKVPFETAASLQKLGTRASYIKIAGNGSNALDFHIAYYIGKLAAADPTAYFHIVSKDAGFDPLIQHLKAEGIFAGRVKAITEIPVVKASTAKTPPERNQVAATWLQQTKATKPRTIKTLTSTVASLFQKQLSDEEVAVIVHWLAEQGHLAIAGTKVSYAPHGNA